MLSWGTLPAKATPRTTSGVAIPGEYLSNRISADAVGRRGHFPQGAIPSRFLCPSPLREMRRAGGPKALPKAGVGLQSPGQPGRPGTDVVRTDAARCNYGTADPAPMLSRSLETGKAGKAGPGPDNRRQSVSTPTLGAMQPSKRRSSPHRPPRRKTATPRCDIARSLVCSPSVS